MKFLNILNFPNILKNRNEFLINPIKIDKIDKYEDKIDIYGIIKAQKSNDFWRPSILFLSNKISQTSEVLVDCNCPSFMFEFYYILYKNNALKYPDKVDINLLKPGLKTSTILSTCKHIIALSKVITHNFGKINQMKINKK
jgi:hypothetical protein